MKSKKTNTRTTPSSPLRNTISDTNSVTDSDTISDTSFDTISDSSSYINNYTSKNNNESSTITFEELESMLEDYSDTESEDVDNKLPVRFNSEFIKKLKQLEMPIEKPPLPPTDNNTDFDSKSVIDTENVMLTLNRNKNINNKDDSEIELIESDTFKELECINNKCKQVEKKQECNNGICKKLQCENGICTELQTIKCNICDYSTNNLSRYFHHLNKSHKRNIYCTECKELCSNNNDFIDLNNFPNFKLVAPIKPFYTNQKGKGDFSLVELINFNNLNYEKK